MNEDGRSKSDEVSVSVGGKDMGGILKITGEPNLPVVCGWIFQN